MSRKDSKGMFAAVLGKLEDEAEVSTNSGRSASPHLMKVAAGVRQMQERSDLAERLLKAGEQIVELEPAEISQSTITDRFDESYELEAVSEIMESIRVRGQIVPGLVRPAPGGQGGFQIVYGRRRLEAARRLGAPFKAVVRDLTDEQAVIFQGEENTAREDLSFIEKSAFALAQETAGYSRETIMASLSTGKSHVSEMIKIASHVPATLMKSIGKAPGIGRGRWEEFAKLIHNADKRKLEEAVARREFRSANSDERFVMLLNAMSGKKDRAKKTPTEQMSRVWAASDKSVRVKIKNDGEMAMLALSEANGSRFANYIAGRLDELFIEFIGSDKRS